MRRRSIACLLLAASAAPLAAQDVESPPKTETTVKATSKPETETKESKEKTYEQVITAEAKSDPGLFLVHRVGSKLYYEIPATALGKDMLWVTQLEETQAGYGYPGTHVLDRVLRWELREEAVLLRDVRYTVRTEVDGSIQQAVAAMSVAPILKSFPVLVRGKEKGVVIDVTDLFLSEIPELSAKGALGSSSIDKDLSYLESVKSFPQNVETRVLATYRLPENRGLSHVSVVLHHSMVLLPEKPMKPRRFDDRIGFFTVSFEDYGTDKKHELELPSFITRWRLEKEDPTAPISDPKKPIVFYVGREVPEKWKPWVKRGIEAWRPAFEAAGFSNAIDGRFAPSPTEDPDWDAEDARISTVRWLPSRVENAYGPHIHDPRTGEILEADIRFHHNVIKLIRDWYFVQASPCDERAQKLPFPDQLMGELLAYVVAHEVGHTLGFPHNMKASSSYTVAQLRDGAFTRQFGTEASIMDYGRFNYVAQPGDGAALIPVVGPYDRFAVEWGYRENAEGEDEKAMLEAIAKRQIADPMLRFGGPNPGEDPTQQTEDLGSDPQEATALGLANLARVAGYLVAATCKEGEDYSLLSTLHEELLDQWVRELGHVVAIVGGFERRNFRYGDGAQVYWPVEPERQRKAVAFLCEHAFKAPPAFVAQDITLRLEASGSATRLIARQQQILGGLLAEHRVVRMAEHASRAGDGSYGPAAMLADVRGSLWSELAAQPPRVDYMRRALQRSHVEILIAQVDGSDEYAGLARRELAAIRTAAAAALAAGPDADTAAHLENVVARVRKAFDPE